MFYRLERLFLIDMLHFIELISRLPKIGKITRKLNFKSKITKQLILNYLKIKYFMKRFSNSKFKLEKINAFQNQNTYPNN